MNQPRITPIAAPQGVLEASGQPAANEDLGLPASPQDWSQLVDALAQRLRRVIDDDAPGVPPPAWDDPTLLDTLQQFGGSLDRLGHSLDLGRSRRLDHELFEARLALARTRARLKRSLAAARLAQHEALHDALTTLPNRQGFHLRLDRSMPRRAPTHVGLAVLCIDLDGFKSVNDQHGHAVGDALLRIVGARLRGALRPEDSAGRLGGDEFACLVRNLSDRAALERLAAKLGAILAEPVRIGALTLQVSASIGVAVWAGDGDSGDALLRRADQAMYRAKHLGCGHAFQDETPPA